MKQLFNKQFFIAMLLLILTLSIVTAPTNTLTIVDGYDQKNDKTLEEEGKTYVFQSSDDDRWDIEKEYYTSLEFSDISLQPGETISSVIIYVEHYEEKGFSKFGNKLQWDVGTGWPNSATIYGTTYPSPRLGESKEGVDSWDVTNFVDTENKLNSMELRIKNNDKNKKSIVDYVYAVVTIEAGAFCGNNIIEGTEVCDGSDLSDETCITQGYDGGTLGCESDCSGYDTLQCYSDSCSDTDGGNVPETFGTTSGFFDGNPYSSNDYCVDAGAIMEYYCNGIYETSQQQSCGADVYGTEYCSGDFIYKDFTDYFCAGGACSSNTTPVFQENCNSYDSYGTPYCYNSSVYRDFTNYYCSGGACDYYVTPDFVEFCPNGCSNGVCNTPPDSCTDSDGGNFPLVFGTVSGYEYGNPYSHDDFCLSSDLIGEYICIGDTHYLTNASCGTDGYYGSEYCSGDIVYNDWTDYYCISGVCGSNSTPVFQENCDTYDSYGSNYCSGDDVYKDYFDYYCTGGACDFTQSPELVESCNYGCSSGACNPPPTPNEVTLYVKEGFDEKNQETLTQQGKLYYVQNDDTDRIETEATYITSYEFDSYNFPANAEVNSVEIYVVHYEEADMPDGMLQWDAGQGTLTNPITLLNKTPLILREESNEGTEVFDVSSVIDTPNEVNDLKFIVRNYDYIEYKKTFTDYIYVVVEYYG